jgi:hypothetical protein
MRERQTCNKREAQCLAEEMARLRRRRALHVEELERILKALQHAEATLARRRRCGCNTSFTLRV